MAYHRFWSTTDRRARPVLALSAIIAFGATACSGATSAGPPSTVAAGSPWAGAFTTVVLPAPVNSLHSVDCPTETSCWAVGATVGNASAPNGAAILATSDGGSTWTPEVIPPVTGYLSAIACSDQRTCVAVGQAAVTSNGQALILSTTDGGRVWQSRPVPPGFLDVTAVSCRTDHRCAAVGDIAGGAATLTSTSGGSTWVERGALPAGVGGATGISCPSDAQCWVTARRTPDPDHVAGVVALTVDGGSDWNALTVPNGIGYLNAVSCPSPGAGASASSSTTATSGPSTTGGPSAAVLAGAQCVVVGTTSSTLNGARAGHGVVLTTANGGLKWSSQPVAASTASLADVSCTGADSCVMVGSAVSTSARAGSIILTGPPDRPWTRAAALDAAQPLTGVSCVSQSRCLVVGESISEHLVGG